MIPLGSSFDGRRGLGPYLTALLSAPRSSFPASIQLYTIRLLISRCRAISAVGIRCSR